ncbi:DNA segregation ATPase and related proteins (FtsK/SpoIIIE family) [Bifidobacterium samirii]|uniref:DNA segregation ATPase and related proteins (FtsK/SpoIIIE family) n=1 Tax=Bifidobacterium samirii TaxID=2306974 RepID=A0A430FUJ9_9BIFI|nr:DNA segregation ATPase and related proteins (FtsK/SpoIIIE family) [Bifidobacterium samirii]
MAGAPLAAQIVMIAVMLAQGRWLFALMVLPSAVGCVASLLLAAGRSAIDRSDTGPDGRDDGRVDGSRPAVSGTSAARPEDGPAVFPERCPPWEELALPDPAAEPLVWRHIVRRWLAGGDWAAVLGIDAESRPYRLDLTRQGPHALVAGTTGSGKSVLLETWCLALACANPPSRLTFVFLDFKGGSTFNRLSRLPHARGTVGDLDLAHAVRALAALEEELRRREALAAAHGVGDLSVMDDPPPRLVIVVDEFHALRAQLPDYVDRLTRIAAVGRSLGMHLIACTQNPSGQVNAQMHANLSIGICLRVRDAMQSRELVGAPHAAAIAPSMPGAAYITDGGSVDAVRCAAVRDVDALVGRIGLAARFCALAPAEPLFSAPLPRVVASSDDAADDTDGNDATGWPTLVPFALADDGIALHTASLRLDEGNIAVVGGHGRGRSTLLGMLERRLAVMPGVRLTVVAAGGNGFRVREHARPGSWPDAHGSGPGPPPPPPSPRRARRTADAPVTPDGCADDGRRIWLVDDADALLDPMAVDPMAHRLRRAMRDPGVTVVFAVLSMRHVRVPDDCTTRIVFPSGERHADLMLGIPADLLSRIGVCDPDVPGRAVLLEHGRAVPVQCHAGNSPPVTS